MKFLYKIRCFYRSVGRFFYWGWKLRDSYDFDYAHLLEMIYLKMERMEPEIFVRSYSNHLKRFKVAKESIRRLIHHNYDANIDYPKFTLEDSGFYVSKHENPKKFKRQCDHSEKMRQADLERFCTIFKKDIFKWWD